MDETPPIRVALDARAIDHSGIGTAIEGWLEGWAGLPRRERPRLTLIGDPRRLGEWAGALEAPIVAFRARMYSWREQALFPAARGRWDLLHVPHYAHPLAYRGRLVATVHDLFHWKYGGALKALYQMAFLAALKKRGGAILTVSEHARRELIQRAGFASERVIAVPHGLSARIAPSVGGAEAAEFRRRRGLPERYALWIGIDQPHKNLDRLLDAFALPTSQGGCGIPLVLAGRKGIEAKAMARRIARRGLQGRAFAIGAFAPEEAGALFAGALALVLPSLEEGFGFTPLEAMARGVPAAVSDRPPLNEHCAGAALLFDPESAQEIARAIRRLAEDAALRADLIRKGLERAGRFRCDAAARELARAYRIARGRG